RRSAPSLRERAPVLAAPGTQAVVPAVYRPGRDVQRAAVPLQPPRPTPPPASGPVIRVPPPVLRRPIQMKPGVQVRHVMIAGRVARCVQATLRRASVFSSHRGVVQCTPSQMTMYEDEFNQVQNIVDRLVKDANAKVVFMVDKKGQLIA